MKNRRCPNSHACYDYDASNCEDCAVGKFIEKQKRKIARLTAENERLKAEKTCRNTSEDESKGLFVCSKCKFNTLNYCRLKLNKGDKYYHREYDIKYCPNCGAKVEEEQ